VLAGYGAYGAMLLPSFTDLLPWNPIPFAWIERGGVYAYAHVRGGGELGEAWHQAAIKTRKMNSISDFIACAEFLFDERYTSSERLAIEGGSAGGILVGGALTNGRICFVLRRATLAFTIYCGSNSPLLDPGKRLSSER
jgi:prolyl oligopeptidase